MVEEITSPCGVARCPRPHDRLGRWIEQTVVLHRFTSCSMVAEEPDGGVERLIANRG
jgi:hypothetical protein